MNLSPEPTWGNLRAGNCGGLELRPMLRNLLRAFREPGAVEVMAVHDKNGKKLGSFTPKFFLDLTRREQLKFSSMLKGLHDTGVDR